MPGQQGTVWKLTSNALVIAVSIDDVSDGQSVGCAWLTACKAAALWDRHKIHQLHAGVSRILGMNLGPAVRLQVCCSAMC